MDEKLILDYDSGRITARLDRGEKVLVQNVRIRLPAARRLALIGETGSGKTMTALSILHLLPENVSMVGGMLRFCGKDLSSGKGARSLLGVEIVYIPQNGLEFLNPSRTVQKHLYDSLQKLGVPWRERGLRALEALRAAGFPQPEEILPKYPFQLSGGMAQRVTIALAACSRARLLIADEPTNGLDGEATKRFFQLLDQVFPEAGKIIITHDIAVASLCGRIQVLCGGKAVPYTRALLAALVENGMQPSPPLRPAKGPCPFYRRCAHTSDACLAPPPRQTEDETEWWCVRRD